VLECEDGGGGKDGNLFAICDGFERRAHRDFRLTVTNIAAEQAIHGRFAFHVALDVRDRSVLVVGFFKFERVFNSRCQWPSAVNANPFADFREA